MVSCGMQSSVVLEHGIGSRARQGHLNWLCEDTLGHLGVGVSEGTVVLISAGVGAPVLGVIISRSLEEDVRVLDTSGEIGDLISSASDKALGSDVVASFSVVLQVWIATVVADGFGTLASLEMTLSCSESSIAPSLSASLAVSALAVSAVVLHPGERSPLIVNSERTVFVIVPGVVVSASSGSDLGLGTNGDVGAIDVGGASLMESNTDLDLVVLPLLSEAAQRLLAAHLDSHLSWA